MSQAPAKSGNIGCLGWVIIAVGLLLVGALLNSCGGDESDSELSEYNIQSTCKSLVEDQLKNPSTADFMDESQTLASASGTVVAENALGGKVTFSYSCTATDAGLVTLESLSER